MTDVKHTPGPWTVSCIRLTTAPAFGPDIRLLEVGPSEDRLALVYFDMKTGLGQADARLIAAAPDLLAALKTADDYLALNGANSDKWRDIRVIIQAAIAKAEGRS